VNGWLVSKSAPPEAVDFLKFFSQEKYAKEAVATGANISSVKGSEAAATDPLFKRLASDLAATTYHQNYFDQDLGPSVGRVINDISVAVAAGQTTPEAAAAAIQDAAEQQ
jgi:raffinose/stachyose/melibiose transport system substrate-binding protein